MIESIKSTTKMHWVDIEVDNTVAPSFLSMYLNTTKQDLLSVSVESTESNEIPDLFPAVGRKQQ